MIANATLERINRAWPQLDRASRRLVADITEALTGLNGPATEARQAIVATTRAMSALGSEDIRVISMLTELFESKSEESGNAKTPVEN